MGTSRGRPRQAWRFGLGLLLSVVLFAMGLLGLRVRRIAQGLGEVAELRVDDVAPQAVLDLLVCLTRLGTSPVVVAQLAHRARGVAADGVEHRLAEARVVGRVGEQRGALGKPLFAQGFERFDRADVREVEAVGLRRTVVEVIDDELEQGAGVFVLSCLSSDIRVPIMDSTQQKSNGFP